MVKVVYMILVPVFLLVFLGFFADSSLAAYVFNNDLRRGSAGEDVRQLQIFLNSSPDTKVAESGFGSPGQETDYFGPLTQNAVVRFQIKYGIEPAVGFFGPITRAKVNSLNSESLDYSYAPAYGQTGEEAPSSDYTYDPYASLPAQESAAEDEPVNSPYSAEARARYSWLSGGTSTPSGTGTGTGGTGLFLYNPDGSFSGFSTTTNNYFYGTSTGYYSGSGYGSGTGFSALGLEEPKYPFGGMVFNDPSNSVCLNAPQKNLIVVAVQGKSTPKQYIWKRGTSIMLSPTKRGQQLVTSLSSFILPSYGAYIIGNLKEHRESCGPVDDLEVISYAGQCLAMSQKTCENYYKNSSPNPSQ